MLQAAAATAMTFNLICSGTLTTSTVSGGREQSPFRYEYRIDLAQQKWCDGDCRATQDFADIAPTQLTLQNRREETPDRRESLNVRINRETGVLSGYAASGRGYSVMLMEWEGQCERAAFTGFPTFRTRF